MVPFNLGMVKIHHRMSKKRVALSAADAVDVPDNQQETPQSFFYYTGFCCGEMSCSLLKLSNLESKKGGVYYTPDITVSHSDKSLLREINQVMADGEGVISAIKGGYNLSFRGKRKVQIVLDFFDCYPPIVGDLSLSKIALIKKSIQILRGRRSYRRSSFEQSQLERVRSYLGRIRKPGVPLFEFAQTILNRDAQGFFLSGVFDAEGSLGLKKSGSRKQPFFAAAMREERIIRLFKDFLKIGHIHYRPKEKIFHFEIGSRKEVLLALKFFLEIYPSKLAKLKRKMKKLRRILNDYTPGCVQLR